MAEVFEAELAGELGFVRRVAIKRMLGEAAADENCARRFLDEAQIASRLHHANIVSVMDVGLLDGLPFHVLELVDGLNAHQLAQRAGGTLPIEVALILANGVAHALDHAHSASDATGHSHGIVHRDVKPSNVMVSWEGDVKLTDFGIAVARDRVAMTEAGMVAGTMGFIAPEQRTRSDIDGRADVFALGLSLHVLLTGYTPLRDIEVEMAVLAGQPMTLDASLPDDVRDLIQYAVAPRRQDRPTAALLADLIGAALAPRLHRDPRGFLRAFLAPLQTAQPKVGVLDQLLGIDVVRTAHSAQGPARYELRPTVVAKPERIEEPTARSPSPAAQTPTVRASSLLGRRDASDDPGAAAGSAPGGSSDEVLGASYASTAQRPRLVARSRARWAWLAAIPLAGVGGAVAWRVAGSSGAATLQESVVLVSDAALVAAVVPDAAVIPPPDAMVVAAVTDAAPVDAAPSARVRPASRNPPGRSPERTPPPGTPPVSATAVGYLQITGEDRVGAKVLVDGAFAGYAPNLIEVPVGHRRVEVVLRDGTHLAAKTVDLTEYHSRARPARPTW